MIVVAEDHCGLMIQEEMAGETCLHHLPGLVELAAFWGGLLS